jgi:hypothetical protein
MISASGALSQGLEVEQTDSSGLVTARCEEPGTDFWFVGPGQQSTADIQLSLMNVDGQQADAQVTALTDNGPLLGGTDTGIAVPAHGLVVQSLAKLLHRTRFVALHVTASLGRIVAAVRETTSAALPGAWLPVTQAPAKRSVLPGLPATGGTRQLYVAVPGAANAQVKITAVTPKGSYQPTGGGGLNLPGGSAVGIPLPSLHGIPAAIEVSANVPVAASMMVPGGAAGAASSQTCRDPQEGPPRSCCRPPGAPRVCASRRQPRPPHSAASPAASCRSQPVTRWSCASARHREPPAPRPSRP